MFFLLFYKEVTGKKERTKLLITIAALWLETHYLTSLSIYLSLSIRVCSNTQSLVLTSKLDLPGPGGARATWLRSCQKPVRLCNDFRVPSWPVRAGYFFGGVGVEGRQAGVRLGQAGPPFLMIRPLNLDSGLRRGESREVTSPDWPGMISSELNPQRLMGVATLDPRLLTPAHWPLHGQMIKKLERPAWRFNST